MTWTAFSGLTQATTPQLDANFDAVLASGGNFLCTVAGTNALSLSVTANAPAITALVNGMTFYGVAANTNTASATAAVGAFTARNIYKDSQAGPVLLAGGEIIQNTGFWLTYDATLNLGVGGYHLQTGGAILRGQTVGVGGLQVGTNGTVNLGATLTRLLSSTVTVGFTVIPANTTQDQNVTLTNLAATDNVVTSPLVAPGSGLLYGAFVPAAGSVTLRAANVTASSIAAFTTTMRLTGMGYT